MQTWIVGALIFMSLSFLFRERLRQQWHEIRTDWKKWFRYMWKEWGEPFVIAAAIAIVIRTFLLGPYKIPTGSMRPTLIEGDRIFVDKISYRFRAPRRGEIIVFKFPEDPKKDFVKRLIAFGGEKVSIKNGIAYVNGTRLEDLADVSGYYYYNRNDWKYGQEGQVTEVPQDAYFVLGDNSAHSSDSRNWGFVPEKYLIGRAFLVWWPPNRIGLLEEGAAK